MKTSRTISALLTIMAIFALTFISTAPANAGDDRITICHADKAPDKPYEKITVDRNAVISGHSGSGHQNGADIIPAFDWVDNKNVRQYFDGQNLGLAFMLDNGCNPPNVPHINVVKPVAPIFTPATCLNTSGKVTLSEQPDGVKLVVGPRLNSNPPAGATFIGVWVTVYEALEGYEFEDGTKTVTFTNEVVPAGVGDPNFITDSKTGLGKCEMPRTGGGITDTALMVGGGAIGLGMIFIAAVSLANRRQTL